MKPTHSLRTAAALALVALGLLAAGSADAEAKKSAKQGKAASKPHAAVPFIEDDYTKALAEARARKVPIFIEAWAPW